MCAREGDIAISLGTSDTFFFSSSISRTSRTGHVLVSPLRSDHRLVLVCFKNGSQTRERVSRECSENDWTLFSELLDSTPRGNFGNIALYLDQVEIRPRVSGDFRFNRFDQPVARFSKEVEVRACVEGQFVRLRAHAQQMGFAPPSAISGSTSTESDCAHNQVRPRLLATGGASRNKSLLQVLSDVFNCPVFVQKQPNSACFGSALLAKNGNLLH
jgi:xylulokinase